MERNQLTLAAIAGTAVVAAIALGVVLKGTTPADTPRPEPIEKVAKGNKAKNKAGKNKAQDPGALFESDAIVTTPSGLEYFELEAGTGEIPEVGQTVVAHYTGWLTDGKQFDSSRGRGPFKFKLGAGQVIKGWDETIATMKIGGKRKIRVPPDLAYGPRGRPPTIPPSATLIFEIELVAVEAPRSAPETPRSVKKGEFTTTASGLKYVDFEVGSGAVPQPGQNVMVDYTGWLENGKKFDSSFDRMDPIVFELGKGRVIKGWDEGIATMKVGGKRQLVIPPDIAYGKKGRRPVIPPDSTLIFEVHLVDVR